MRTDSPDVAWALIEAGADVDAQVDVDAASVAAVGGAQLRARSPPPRAPRLLRAAVNVVNTRGKSPLEYADPANTELVALLYAAGAEQPQLRPSIPPRSRSRSPPPSAPSRACSSTSIRARALESVPWRSNRSRCRRCSPCTSSMPPARRLPRCVRLSRQVGHRRRRQALWRQQEPENCRDSGVVPSQSTTTRLSIKLHSKGIT
jgi:hypothetical protein